MKFFSLWLVSLSVALGICAQEKKSFDLREGDRVVFLGNAFFERDLKHGYLEALLTMRWPDRNIIFRNLGWDGDTVWGHARAGFGSVEDGFRNLEKQVTEQKPTVIFVAYGMSESFEGKAGLANFEKGLNRLLDSLTKTGALIVLLSPNPHEKLPTPLPDPTEHNKNLKVYSGAVHQIAVARGYAFVDLFAALSNNDKPQTDNGIHLNALGYHRAALAIEQGLGLTPLPQAMRTGARFENLRRVINEKNELFFHRWRPANETYIFGFRKHEQGRNAVEMPQFDPLIAEKESDIAKLRKGIALAPAPKVESPKIAAESAPDPEIERQSFKVADGFEVNLFAADPMIAKPIQMNFDVQGRLWVAGSSIYPQIQPGEKPNDKIFILEDTNGDGRADKSSVFADGLLIPTGIEVGNGGAYVANSTELVHLRDTNNDGRADQRHVLLSGFGTEDTHHIIHAFRWGPDGAFYFNQSIYIHSHIETPHGTQRLGGSGIWRFRPASMDLEIIARGMINPWGHVFDRWGQEFATDGASGGKGGIHYVFPGASFETAVGVSRVLPGLNAGHPKYCGLELVNGRHLPDDWQGNFITHDFRANRVVRFSVTEDGSGYATKLMPDVIKSTDRAFRPVDVKLGPDGAIYVADWYNPIINHGEVDFRDSRRDKTHGRIWRITAKNRPLTPRPQLVGATTKQLLDHLKASEDWTRHFAKRVLAERNVKDVLPAIPTWLKALNLKDPHIEHHRLEVLWLYETFDTVEPQLLVQLLRSPEPRARAAATRTLAHWHNRIPNALDLLAAQVADEHPRVRLEAVRALGLIRTPRAIEVAMRALDKDVDKFLDYALWVTTNDLKPLWLPALERGELSFGGNDKHLQFALQSIGSPKAVETMLAQLRTGKIAPDRQENVFNFIANFGGQNEITSLFEFALEKPDAKAFAALERAARQRKIKPSGDLTRLKPLLTRYDSAIRLAGAWKVEALRADIMALAETKQNPAAFAALADLGGAESIAILQKLSVNPAAVAALASLDPKAAAPRAAEILVAKPDSSAELITAFLQRDGGAQTLAEVLTAKKMSPDAAKLALRVMYAAGRSDEALEKVLKQSAGLAMERTPLSPAELQQLVADVQKKGSAGRGDQIFRRAELACLQCHAVAGVGGKLAPDLRSIGASAPVDYLIESLLDPNKAVKEGFHSVVVTTSDDELFVGIPVRKTEKELVLRDAAREEIIIPLGDIKNQRDGGSLMPSGLTDLLTQQELLDLVRYLSELGRTK